MQKIPNPRHKTGLWLSLLLLLTHLPWALAETATVTYLYSDAQGSVVAAADAQGRVLWRESYAPYGERQQRPVSTDAHAVFYTGKPHDDTTGLSYLGARYYDPALGRFLSEDPVGSLAAEQQPMLFNRYAYAHNNPYKYSDPDGRNAVLALGGVVFETGQWLQGKGFDGGSVLGALADGYNGEGDGFLPAAGEDVLTFGGGAVGAVVKLYRVAKGADALMDVGRVAKGAEEGSLNLFKWGKDTTTKADGWKEGDFMLHLPDKGSPKANWAQNSSRLREEMGRGNPIYDSYRNPTTGERIPTGGFLRAERNLLESRGWKYDSSTGAYHPPGN